MISCHYFLFPTNPIYPFSVFPIWFFNPVTYIFNGLIWIYLLISLWSNVIFVVTCSLIFVMFIIKTIYNTAFVSNQASYDTLNSLRTSRNLPLAYLKVEILHKNVNNLIEPFIIPVQTLITQIVLYCNYILITQWDHLETMIVAILLMFAILFTVLWTVGLEIAGQFHRTNIHILRSWKYFDWSKSEMKQLSKFRKARRPLAFRVGGYYCIKRLHVLKFLKGLTNGTLRAVLAMKNSKGH